MGAGVVSFGVKLAWLEVNHSPLHLMLRLRKCEAITALPCMSAWCGVLGPLDTLLYTSLGYSVTYRRNE
jgi:hypothetical protein